MLLTAKSEVHADAKLVGIDRALAGPERAVREDLILKWGPAGQLDYSGGKWTTDRTYSRDGYSLVRWTRGGLQYWAVSDIDPGDLELFRQTFEKAASS